MKEKSRAILKNNEPVLITQEETFDLNLIPYYGEPSEEEKPSI